MWNKGSYDVSNQQHDNNQLSVVVFDDQQIRTIISIEKTESALDRSKWISRIQEKLVIWLIGALFLMIFVLIGVTIWLSVSIHFNNRDHNRTISSAMHLLISHKFKQNTKSEDDGIVRDIDQSCGISCADVLKATFHLTGNETTVKEVNFSKSSLPNHLSGTTTIMSTSNERFPLLETNHRTKSSSRNDSEMILQSSTINKTDDNDSTEDDSDSEEDELDKDGELE